MRRRTGCLDASALLKLRPPLTRPYAHRFTRGLIVTPGIRRLLHPTPTPTPRSSS